jgi:hypothetical protein
MLFVVALLASCISAPVSYALPAYPGAPAGVPSIHTGPVYGYLFYYSANGPRKAQPDRALISSGGGIAGSYATKILWHIRGGSNAVTVTGRRLDGPGRFLRRFRAGTSGAGGWFPSIVVVPAAGGWRLTVSSDRRVGRFAFWVRPERSCRHAAGAKPRGSEGSSE